MRRLITVAIPLALLGCRSWATAADYEWRVQMNEKVDRNAPLRFTVHITKDGVPVEGLSYWWLVDWVGVHGWEHKGVSFEEQSIRSKGGIGRGFVRIYAYDRFGKLEQVAKHPFEME